MRPTRGMRHRAGRMAVLVAVAASIASCASDGDRAEPPADSRAASDASTVGSDPLFVRTTDDESNDDGEPDDDGLNDGDGSAPVGASPESTTTTTTTTIPLVSDTGVPGIDSDDDFCRAWSQFAGSFRAIGLVTAIRDEDAGMRLEVIASQAVVDAVEQLGVHLPAELEPERDTLLSDYAGPFFRRADKAVAALTAAGVDGDSTALLADAWLVTLAEVGIDDPSLDIDIPAAVDAATVDAAVADFIATTPAIGEDPSLTTFIEIPLTDSYTFDNCPDAGTLAGNDDL